MKKILLCLLTILLSAALVTSAIAHSGRTDSAGGHKDNKNASGLGPYHYHHGYGPHLHTGGVCPYDTPAVSTPAPAPAPVVPKVTVSGQAVSFDQQPENVSGRVLVPIRFVVEMIGCTVEWDEETQTVYVNEANVVPEKNAPATDELKVYVNNEPVEFPDQQPISKNGRVLVPVRFVIEKLGYTVGWDDDSQTVIIEKA